MTEISAQAVETVAAKSNKKAFSGVLSNIDRVSLETGDIMFARLTTAYMGRENVRTLSISGEALGRVESLLVEGASVRLYGDEGEAYVTVIGPDLTKRTLAREAQKANTVAVAAPALSDKEIARRKAYGERMRGYRAAAQARRAAEANIASA